MPYPADKSASAAKRCPWCGGGLAFRRAYPLTRLFPGEDGSSTRHEDVPEAFRTVRAWVCATPLCKYRESA
jgi:hypothetical protein